VPDASCTSTRFFGRVPPATALAVFSYLYRALPWLEKENKVSKVGPDLAAGEPGLRLAAFVLEPVLCAASRAGAPVRDVEARSVLHPDQDSQCVSGESSFERPPLHTHSRYRPEIAASFKHVALREQPVVSSAVICTSADPGLGL
jgi:hypothetical protein